MPNTIVLLPAYCPGQHFIHFVEQLKEASVDTVVVNDGSPKEYQTIFDSLSRSSVVLQHKQNQGKGAALKTGMRYIHTHYDDCVIVTADADGQHLIEDILHCASEAQSHPDHLVLGVRDFQKSNVPLRSAAGNRFTAFLFWLFTGRKLSDTQTGLRAFHSNMIPFFLEIEGSRYEYEMNQLLYAASNKIPFLEVGIETVYLNGNRSSHYRPFQDSLRILRQFLLFTVSSLSGFLIDYSAFSVLTHILPGASGILWANIIARIISGTCNYEINRKVVFQSPDNHRNGFLKYVALAGGILLLNTVLLSVLTFEFHIPAWFAKLLTELLLFLVSWTLQKNFVFANGKKGVIA